MDVEALAVAKVQEMFARCPYLKAFVSSNDRTPFTDGHLDLYFKLGQKKADWRGRVSIQVKGRARRGRPSPQVSFRISRVDLRAFRLDAGVLYLYVAVDEEGECTPYYALLSPFKIDAYLNRAPSNQATISVQFKRFPDRPDEIQRIAALALKTKDQHLTVGYDPAVFAVMKSLTVHTAVAMDLNAPLRLKAGELDYALEATTEGGLTLPLDGELYVYPQAYVEHSTDLSIGAGGVTYERVLMRRVNAATVQVSLGPAITLSIQETGQERTWNLSYSAPGSFVERLRAVRFLMGLAETQTIDVNGNASPLSVTTGDSRAHVDRLRSQLLPLVELEELFDRLGVDKTRIDLEDIDARALASLRALHEAFLNGKDLSNDDGATGRGLVRFGQWAVMLLSVPGDAPGTWRYIDPFDPSAPHMLRWSPDNDDSDSVPVTSYDIVEPEYLTIVLNLRLDHIRKAYESISDSERTLGLANQRVLALIAGADSSAERKDEFLRAAEVLNEWIIEQEGESAVHLVNRWQILRRTIGLSSELTNSVRSLKRRVRSEQIDMADEIELCCAILLGDKADVEYLTGEIAPDRLALVRRWPIWQLRGAARTDGSA